jgi:hypothetical protein
MGVSKSLALAATAFFAASAFADLDFSAVSAQIDARAAAATGRTLAACVSLKKTLVKSDRAGLVDDFAKLRAVAGALSGRLAGDATLADAVDEQIVAGFGALDAESTHLTETADALTSAGERARCGVFGKRGDANAAAAAKARGAGRVAAATTYARRAAAAYENGAALAMRLFARQSARGLKWSVPLSGRGGALLSVWTGPGLTPDVYVVGADDGAGPTFLRMGAEGWVRVPVGPSGDLWWVTGVGGQVYAAGTGGRVVRYDPATGDLADLSTGVNVILFGVWGASTNEVWAVGGNDDGTVPRTALMRHDGVSWTSVDLPEAANNRTLFKVWGAAADDVWVCGQAGLLMHYDGHAWSVVPSDTFESLFTVHGSAPTIAVGGAVQPTIVEDLTSGFASAAVPAGSNDMRGVFVPAKGEPWACGLAGTLMRRVNGTWSRVGGLPALSADDFHAVAIDDAGAVYVVGGDLSVMDRGTLLYYGSRPLPPANAVYPQAKLSEKIAPIFSADHGVFRQWSCAVGGCHVAASPSGDLDLFVDPHSMWSRLVRVKSSESPLLRVLPGRPSQSYLVQKLAGTQAGRGPGNDRMPFGGPYLDDADMDAVRAWILEGARDN